MLRVRKQSTAERSWGADTYVVVVAVRTELVRLFVLREILAERLAALFANERHLDRLAQPVVLRLGVAFRTLAGSSSASASAGDSGYVGV